MRGYTIQNSIDLLEKEVANGSGDPTTAANVSYDNTGSGLAADDVQDAIDELSARSTGVNYPTTETLIGKVGNEDLYGVLLDCGTMPNNTVKNVAHGLSNIKFIYTVRGIMHNPTSGLFIPIPGTTSAAASSSHITLWADDTNVTISTNSDYSAYTSTMVWLEYTKTPQTRSRKTKKED